jgi:hypothetical protein
LGSSWPIHDAIGSKDFRTACFKWAEQLRQEGQLPAGLPLRKSFFDDACGERFEDVLAWISVLGIKNQLSGATHESDNKFLNPSVPLKGEKEVNEFKDALNAKVASLHHQCNLFSEQKRKYELLAEYASGAELSAETTNDPVFLEAFKSIPPVSHEGDGFQSLDQQVKQLKEHINAHYSQPFTDRREELKASLQSLHAEYEENLLTNRRLRHEIEATMSKLKCVPTKPNDPPQGPTINPAILEKLFSWELINPKPAKAASLPFADVTGDFLVE